MVDQPHQAVTPAACPLGAPAGPDWPGTYQAGSGRGVSVEQVGAALLRWYRDVLAVHDQGSPPVPGSLPDPGTGLPVLDQVEDPYAAAPQIRAFLTTVHPAEPGRPPHLVTPPNRTAPSTNHAPSRSSTRP